MSACALMMHVGAFRHKQHRNLTKVRYLTEVFMKKAVGLFLAAALLLSGCGILPAEEEMKKAPVVQTVDDEYFTTAEVKTGNIRDYVSVKCTYQYQMTQSLSFSIGGESIKETYVTVGQKVHAGDVLAELSTETIEEELASCRELCAQLEEETEYYEGLLNIEKERAELAKKYGKKYDESALKRATNNYEECAGRKYVADIRLGELETDLNGRKLVAGIDGVVDYIKDIPQWLNGRINAGEKYITIRSEKTGFTFATTDDSLYHFGDIFTITTNNGSYECEVVKIKRNTGGSSATFFLEPLKPDDALTIGMNGNIILETGSRTNVVYIPTDALRKIDERDAVYVTDEDGMRSIRFVEIGLSVKSKPDYEENRTEIISGLVPGETVILK